MGNFICRKEVNAYDDPANLEELPPVNQLHTCYPEFSYKKYICTPGYMTISG